MTAENTASLSTAAERERFTVFGVEFAYLGLLGILTAFAGWITENTFKAITDGVIDARFHTLPFISAYAFIPFALHILLGSADDIAVFGKRLFKESTKKSKISSNVLTYVICCSMVFLGELGVGLMWDKLFGVMLWDYSEMPLHITKYTGVIPMFGFGTGVYLLFKFVHTPLLKFARNKIPLTAAKIIVSTLGTLIMLDMLWLIVQIIFNHEAIMLWRIILR